MPTNGVERTDGNNNNEVFLPLMVGVKQYQLSVFNRRGVKIFETADPAGGRDGSFKGESCKSEVYVWKITISAKGEMKNLTGHVTLYR